MQTASGARCCLVIPVLVRLALFACPAAFRREYADEMLRDLKARNAGIPASCLDLIRTGLTLRLEGLLRDALFAFRGLAKVPLYTFVTIATITIAISVNVAVASVVEGILLKSLPYPNASRIVYIEQAINNREFSYLNAVDLEKRNRTLDSLGIAWGARRHAYRRHRSRFATRIDRQRRIFSGAGHARANWKVVRLVRFGTKACRAKRPGVEDLVRIQPERHRQIHSTRLR